MIFIIAVLSCPPSSPDFPLCAWFGTGGCVCCDWNEDGSVDGDDLSDYMNDWSAGEPCADITLDGTTDADDLGSFLAAYFGE